MADIDELSPPPYCGDAMELLVWYEGVVPVDEDPQGFDVADAVVDQLIDVPADGVWVGGGLKADWFDAG